MKKIIIATLYILSINVTQAQTYYPLPSKVAIWTNVQCSYWGNTSSLYKTGMFGDTTINSMHYKKIYGSTNYHFNLDSAIYLCALRETGKKVYYIQNGTNSELLLYDFNLQVGDTAKIQNLMGYTELKVDSIDQVLVNGQLHKRWLFNANGSYHYEEYWIEGVGSSFGLLWPLLSISDNIFTLACMSKDGMQIYGNNNLTNFICETVTPYDCDANLTTSIKEYHPYVIQTNVFPNPFSEQTTIETDQELTDAELTVYDVTGVEVYKMNHLTGTRILLYNTHLARGSYYYKLAEHTKLFSKGKLIIE